MKKEQMIKNIENKLMMLQIEKEKVGETEGS